ncbi:hypothetical protein ATANTOWER_023387 [Ataeniobius toweri]|uniref:Uncharacterized protein n=1 Tax=Ataeniobius toweri TaxID=208326 RepID=A0ABU7AR06_9TELE|nr:hypothetical protein [Ataeniobius toweri]
MWIHRHLNRLSSDGGTELVNVSPWAIIAVAVMWCLPLAGELLPGEFAPCGVRDSVVGTVLSGVCPVAPARGPGLAIAPHCVVGGRMRRGCLERGDVWSLRCVCVFLCRLFGDGAYLWGCAPVGRGFMVFGFGGMCSIFVSWLGVAM